jgi:F-type H+-transporting ATPase subunit b
MQFNCYMELIKALGLDVKILLAQLINFSVLFFVMYKFGYKPMLSFLDDRSKKIENGIKDAKKAEERLIEISENEKKTIKKARIDALEIVNEAKKVAEKKGDAMITKAKADIGEIINQEKSKMQVEKAETLKEIKSEISDLVLLSVEKVLEEKMDIKEDKKMVAKVVKKINLQK